MKPYLNWNVLQILFGIFSTFSSAKKTKTNTQLPLDYANQFLGDFSRVDCKKRGVLTVESMGKILGLVNAILISWLSTSRLT